MMINHTRIGKWASKMGLDSTVEEPRQREKRGSDSYHDSPLQKQRFFYFFNELFMAARYKGRMRLKTKNIPYIFLCAKVCRSMTPGCRGTPDFRRYDRELVLKPSVSLEKSWGGYRRTIRGLEKKRGLPLL